MFKGTQVFNRFGPVKDEQTDEELLELADQKYDAQEHPEDTTEGEHLTNDADGDGHDDQTGEFVEGNTAAAD